MACNIELIVVLADGSNGVSGIATRDRGEAATVIESLSISLGDFSVS